MLSTLLTIDDLPDAWISEPSGPDDDNDDLQQRRDECLGDRNAALLDALEAESFESDTFLPSPDSGNFVDHEVAQAADPDAATASLEAADVSGAEDCLAELVVAVFTDAFADQPDTVVVQVLEAIISPIDITTQVDQAVGALIEVRLRIGDEPLSQFLELRYQRSGLLLSQMSLGSIDAPFDRSFVEDLDAVVADRMLAVGEVGPAGAG